MAPPRDGGPLPRDGVWIEERCRRFPRRALRCGTHDRPSRDSARLLIIMRPRIAKIIAGTQLTRNVTRHHVSGMRPSGVCIGRLSVRRMVGALCFLLMAFVASFHAPAPGAADRSIDLAPVVSEVPGDESPIEAQANYEQCHVCGAIEAPAALASRMSRVPLRPQGGGRLLAISPKVTGPPPRG